MYETVTFFYSSFYTLLYFSCYTVAGEAILGAESSVKPLGGRGCAPNPAWGTYSAPLDGEEGARSLIP